MMQIFAEPLSIFSSSRSSLPCRALPATVAQVEPWRDIFLKNIPLLPPSHVPLFFAQGDADTVVRPDVTERFASKACANGSTVTFKLVPGAGHGFVAHHVAKDAAAWIADRFASLPPPNECGRIDVKSEEAVAEIHSETGR